MQLPLSLTLHTTDCRSDVEELMNHGLARIMGWQESWAGKMNKAINVYEFMRAWTAWTVYDLWKSSSFHPFSGDAASE
ncbi:hypothetical protein [Chroococcidiopsis sp. CCMEE 29]|uniref:hypothetical protein n=1 Tax=Chroococcidiopsis sp. CCMEE 29 TaxID=155894 RepID=UPI002020F62A|nr:hypothetical protein [Chroococcidiopsis sp. CCMEE 29]